MTGSEVTPTQVTLTKEQIRWENQQEHTQHSKLPLSVPRSVEQCYLLLAGDIATNAVKCVRWYMEDRFKRASDSTVRRLAGFSTKGLCADRYEHSALKHAGQAWQWLHQTPGRLTADDCFDAVGVDRAEMVAELRQQFGKIDPAELARLDQAAGL